MGVSARLRLGMRVFFSTAAVGLLLFALHNRFGLGGDATDTFFEDYLYNALMLAAAAACILRAVVVREERLAWSVMGAGLALWTAGELYWTLVLANLDEPPFPSVADYLYLAFYPASYVCLLLLIRSRIGAFRQSLWLDGAIGALAVASVAVTLAFEPIVEATSGTPAAVAVNLAYPLGDLLLVALVVTICGLSGWRPGRAWLLIGCGLALSGIGDGIYLVQAANGTYAEGTLLDALWPASALLVALAAWQPPKRRAAQESQEGFLVIVVPSVCGVLAVALLAYDHFERIADAAVLLTTATLLLVTLRMILVFLENQRMLAGSRREAVTDSLTGLRNRRGLMVDLERELAAATEASPRAVVLFDLDGFKEYNDAFGHLAGDDLLARLGERLAAAVSGRGRAYRLGGDEFCVLVEPRSADVELLVGACISALSEHGEGFVVEASHGSVVVPLEATTPQEALQLADRRMYARKGGRRMSAGRQSRDVLLRTLSESQPDLHDHLHGVADLALAVGREVGMGAEELDEVARAAELHDLGKIAIPDAILDKPGPLDEAEWAFMRRHTIIGERI